MMTTQHFPKQVVKRIVNKRLFESSGPSYDSPGCKPSSPARPLVVDVVVVIAVVVVVVVLSVVSTSRK